MKLKSNEFEPRWVLTTKFHLNRSTGSGRTGEDTGQNDRQTNKQDGRRLGSHAPLSNFRALPFRNNGLNQNFVETLYAGNVGHHYTKISENWIKNCRSSISRDPSENEVFRSQFHR